MNQPAAPDEAWPNYKSFLIRFLDQDQKSVLVGQNIPNSNPKNVGLTRIRTIFSNNSLYTCLINKNKESKARVISLNSLYVGKNNSAVGSNYPFIVSNYLHVRANFPEVGKYYPYICFNTSYVRANYSYVGANCSYIGLNYSAVGFSFMSADSSCPGQADVPELILSCQLTQNKMKGENYVSFN